MGANDGFVIGLKKILDHGPASVRFNFVVVAEGFQASEMTKFHQEASKFVDKLFHTAPYPEVWCGINVYRLDVASTESGADEPAGGKCTGSGVTRKTYFDATFCSGGIQRLLTVDSALVLSTVKSYLPEYEAPIVIVNSTTYGGSGGAVATYSLGLSPFSGKGGVEIAIHEVGHSAFQFADEYSYDSGDHYAGPEPAAVNITANADKATIKWKDLILPATLVPTKPNPDCTKEDGGPSPVPLGTVGAFEGAGYFHCGLYRPEDNCQMRELGNPFCAVCQRRISEKLQPYTTPTTVTLVNSVIDFKDIPEGVGGVGVTTYRAALYEVGSCVPVSLQVTAGPTGGFGLPLGSGVVVSPGAAASQGRIWVSYTSTVAGATASGTMTVHCAETNESWVITLQANTVARPKSAVALVLDHSGSMSDDPGDGTTKVGKLRQAVKTFVDVMLPGDGLGLVRFDDTAQIVMAVGDLAANGGPAKTAIDGPQFDPAGSTSIGDGLKRGAQALAAAPGSYAVKAIVVLTDGMENTAPFIADVSSSITANTFGIGFGTPANVDVGKLEKLTGNREGYLLVTGGLTPSETFRLQKYFLQILAGVTNADIVLDPTGTLFSGQTQRIPIPLTEADYGADVIVLAADPRLIDFQLETPDGTLIDASIAAAAPNIQLVRTPDVAYYRVALPALPADAGGSHAGTWYAHLRLADEPRIAGVAGAGAQVGRHGVDFSLMAHSYSNLRLHTVVAQSGYSPGSVIMLSAILSEYGIPVEGRATVWADVTRPDGSLTKVTMAEVEPGRFAGSLTGSSNGLYTLRVRASGLTLRDRPFTREQTLTAAIGPIDAGGDGAGGGHAGICGLLDCLVDLVPPSLRNCIRRVCSGSERDDD